MSEEVRCRVELSDGDRRYRFDQRTRSLLVRLDGDLLPVWIAPYVGQVLRPGFVGEVIIEPLHEGVVFDPRPGTTFEVWYGDVIGHGVVGVSGDLA